MGEVMSVRLLLLLRSATLLRVQGALTMLATLLELLLLLSAAVLRVRAVSTMLVT